MTGDEWDAINDELSELTGAFMSGIAELSAPIADDHRLTTSMTYIIGTLLHYAERTTGAHPECVCDRALVYANEMRILHETREDA